MQDPLPLNNKPFNVRIWKRLVFTIFYTNGGLFTKVLNSFSFSQKNVYKMATFHCTNRHWTTWIFQLVQLQKSNRTILSASLICYKSISHCLHNLSLTLRWRKKNCIIWLSCFKCHGKEFTPKQQKFCFIYRKTVHIYSFIH